MKKLELIIVILNSGYSDALMDAARDCGAKGGTVINARGTAKEEVEKKFDIQIHPEKEIVLIVAPVTIKDKILHAVYQKFGTNSNAQGIAFTVPVDDQVGVTTK